MPNTRRLLVSTRNRHKLAEIRSILGDAFQCVGLEEFPDAPAVVEDQTTFEGNAAKKVLELAQWIFPSHQPSGIQFVLADDSGLEVDALHGAPGVHSARFAAASTGQGNTPDEANNQKLLELLKDVPAEKRNARFRCVLALVELTAQSSLRAPHSFEGVCEGRMDFEPHGHGGFGYDPLFIPLGHNQSFAQLGEDIKNQISHRANALRKLKQWLDSGA